MNRAMSLYLDCLRILAAGTVFLGHLGSQRLSGGFLWQMQSFGPRAVMLFFVLSGFVITYTAETKDRTLRSYATSRISRLYSVILPALIVTAVFDNFGCRLNPYAYKEVFEFDQNNRIMHHLMALFNLGYIWNFQMPPGTNTPFWSLCYEFWYYIIFAGWFYFRGLWRFLLSGGAIILAGPNIALLLPVWLMGAATYRIVRQGGVGARLGVALFAGSLLLVAGYFAYLGAGPQPHRIFPEFEFAAPREFMDRDYLERWFLGLCVCMNLVGYHGFSDRLADIARPVEAPVRWAAGYTFSLYAFHAPIAQLEFALTDGDRTGWGQRFALYAGSLVVVWIFGALSEHKRHVLRYLLDGPRPSKETYRA